MGPPEIEFGFFTGRYRGRSITLHCPGDGRPWQLSCYTHPDAQETLTDPQRRSDAWTLVSELTPREAQQLEEALAAVLVPIASSRTLCMDGARNHLRIGDGGTRLELEWGMEFPEAWASAWPLVGTLQRLLDLSSRAARGQQPPGTP